MTKEELLNHNKKALRIRKDIKTSFEKKCMSYPYFGFIEVEISNCQKFVMFSNNDDIVAKHYFFNGKDAFEPLSLVLWSLLAKHSKYVYDVGSFTGIYSICAALSNKESTVVGFEPSGKTFQRFVSNILTNQLYNQIIPLNMALGEANYRSTIKHPAQLYALASGESILNNSEGLKFSEEPIEVFPADTIPLVIKSRKREFPREQLISGLDLVKIDVEGYELNVLEGMQESITMYKPTMIIECLNDKAFSRVKGFLKQFNYNYYFINDTLMKLQNRSPRSAVSRNIIFYNRPEIYNIISEYI